MPSTTSKLLAKAVPALAPHLVRGLIYPVPDPALPFLGTHFTRHVDGEVTIGPTALLAGARDAYRLQTVRREDVLDALSWPGTWRMLGRHWRAAAIELRRSLRPAALVRAAAVIVPELRAADVEPAFAGVRAQALARNGRLLEDFAFSSTPHALHVRNARAAQGAVARGRRLTGADGPAHRVGRGAGWRLRGRLSEPDGPTAEHRIRGSDAALADHL